MRAVAWAGAMLFAVALGGFALRYALAWGHPADDASSPVSATIAANVALFSAFALHHSILARSGAKRWLKRLLPAALERTAYVWVASLLFLAVCLLWQPLPGVAWSAEGPARLALYAVQLAGLGLTLGSASRLDIWDLAGIRQVARAARSAAGGSTTVDAPPPEHTGALEASGPYRWVRHPIYLGWVLLVFGSPTMTMTRLLWALVSTAYLVVAIPLEERGLVAEFGPAYRDYQRRVRWRLVPGVW